MIDTKMYSEWMGEKKNEFCKYYEWVEMWKGKKKFEFWIYGCRYGCLENLELIAWI